ncbi:hypothetical protein SAMN05216510_2996 [Pseudomonas coleopterorum]|nr:hypothetical protein SAMN05216510_2996 [Pseudomonas coleopterorum]
MTGRPAPALSGAGRWLLEGDCDEMPARHKA